MNKSMPERYRIKWKEWCETSNVSFKSLLDKWEEYYEHYINDYESEDICHDYIDQIFKVRYALRPHKKGEFPTVEQYKKLNIIPKEILDFAGLEDTSDNRWRVIKALYNLKKEDEIAEKKEEILKLQHRIRKLEYGINV